MKLIQPSFKIWEQPAGLEGVYKQIEHVGRICYKSENKITEDSAKLFVDRLIKSQHCAPLEQGTVYLMAFQGDRKHQYQWAYKYEHNPYSQVNFIHESQNVDGKCLWGIAVTTNYRVLVENNWLEDLQYLCEPTKYHAKRITVHFILDRAIANEFVRHRVFSFAQESTRYCNYSKDKFGNELTFIIPCWLNLAEGNYKWEDQNPLLTAGLSIEEVGYDDSSNLWIKDSTDGYSECKRHYNNWEETETFMHSLQIAEDNYLALINIGWKPQQARSILPLALKTELVMTGFVSDWKHFFNLRALGTTGAPHPQAKELAEPLMKEFIAREYIEGAVFIK